MGGIADLAGRHGGCHLRHDQASGSMINYSPQAMKNIPGLRSGVTVALDVDARPLASMGVVDVTAVAL
eukprot:38913-Eustigmatos_ZCMA.PRE.1